MTKSTDRLNRGRTRAPGKDRVAVRVGPLLGAPPPITFRTPQRPAPSAGAPELFYSVMAAAPGADQGVLELSSSPGTRLPALSVVCCVTGVPLAQIAPMVLDHPVQVSFPVPDVPGNIRLEISNPADNSVNIQHPPARNRSFGVERMRARRPVAVPKLTPFAGFRRHS